VPEYCVGNVILLVEVTECVEKLDLDFFFVDDIPLCLLNWNTTKQFLVSVKHNNIQGEHKNTP